MKKKSLKSIIALTLAAMMSMGILAGCGTKSSDNTSASSGSTEKSASADQPGWKEDTSPITLDWYMNFSWFAAKWGQDATSQYITKKTGVNINYVVPAGNETEKLNTMLASGKLPDIITLGWYEDAIKKMIEGQMVLPLNDLAKKYDMYFTKVADPQKLAWYTKDDGNVYEYPNASSSPKDFETYKNQKPSNQTFLVRKDMYEALGKPDMRTQEGFLNALKAAKEKFPSVNGQPMIPLGLHEFTDTGCYSLEAYLQNFLGVPFEKDGKIYDRYSDPEYLGWLKTFRKANENGLLAKDLFIDKRAQMEEKIAQGRYFAMIYQRSDMANDEQALYNKDKNSVYIAVDGPENAKQDPPKLAGDGLAGWTVTLISKNNKDPKRAIRFLSYLISDEGVKDSYLGPKGVTYDNIDGKDQFKPEVLTMMNSDRAAFDKKYGASYTHWMLMDTNKQLQWAPPTAEPAKQMEDWTKGKTYSYALYDDIKPTGSSDEGIAQNSIDQLFGKTLPKLIMSKTDADFDKTWDEFVAKRKALGFDIVSKYNNDQFTKNKKRLDIK